MTGTAPFGILQARQALSPELASYYSKVFTDAGVAKFKFVITPATK